MYNYTFRNNRLLLQQKGNTFIRLRHYIQGNVKMPFETVLYFIHLHSFFRCFTA